ncbi:MAG: indolepyruvate ferredoxin oxidoreductase subunit alpha, partial [bacterium]|nr:indolepyruvate ferredoxin oxidoreductase subunit alpha [bacterium]
MPVYAFARHIDLGKRVAMLEAVSNTCDENRMEMRDLECGVITSGISYQNVREALPLASTLKIGMTYPIPEELISSFSNQVNYLYVVEENRGFLEEAIRAMGIKVDGKGDRILQVGELSATTLRKRIFKEGTGQKGPVKGVPGRPPQFCPGCGHTAVFHILKELKLAVNGDIGCYGLAALPPYDMTDSVICMGGGMTLNQGFAKVAALRENARPAVGVVGDSTFFHSGLTGVANMVYNKTPSTVLILDNRTTAMTGHQPNPTSGNKIGGEASPPLDIGEICRALGVKHVHEVDATDIDRLKEI